MNLKAYLANQGMTMIEFAKLLDCKPNYISSISRKEKTPGRRLARDIEIATNGMIKLEVKKRKIKGKNQPEVLEEKI